MSIGSSAAPFEDVERVRDMECWDCIWPREGLSKGDVGEMGFGGSDERCMISGDGGMICGVVLADLRGLAALLRLEGDTRSCGAPSDEPVLEDRTSLFPTAH